VWHGTHHAQREDEQRIERRVSGGEEERPEERCARVSETTEDAVHDEPHRRSRHAECAHAQIGECCRAHRRVDTGTHCTHKCWCTEGKDNGLEDSDGESEDKCCSDGIVAWRCCDRFAASATAVQCVGAPCRTVTACNERDGCAQQWVVKELRSCVMSRDGDASTTKCRRA
jgi:hypothetical protein